MSHRTLPIDKIVVGERSRTEARAVESLSRSIREHSLIQPPVVRRDGDRFMLVCGMRRLAAMRSLGWTETPVTVAETINDELAALYAEGDENTEREPFTAAEAVAHRRRIRDAEARAAKERQREGGRKRTKLPKSDSGGGKLPQALSEKSGSGKARDRSAKPTGYGARTLDRRAA